jgi:hypothetical protein
MDSGQGLLRIYGSSRALPSELYESPSDSDIPSNEKLHKQVSDFTNVPLGFWKSVSNQRRYLDWALGILGHNDLSGWFVPLMPAESAATAVLKNMTSFFAGTA